MMSCSHPYHPETSQKDFQDDHGTTLFEQIVNFLSLSRYILHLNHLTLTALHVYFELILVHLSGNLEINWKKSEEGICC